MTREEIHEQIKQICKKNSKLTIYDKLVSHFEKYSNIVIYGAGNAGKVSAQYLNQHYKKDISCFLDKNADSIKEVLGIPVYKPDDPTLTDEFKKDSIVIVAVLLPKIEDYEKIYSCLKGFGYNNYYYYYYGPTFCYDESERNDRENLMRETDKIIEAFDLMSDTHSQEVYFKSLNALAELDFDLPIQSDGMTEYIEVDVPFRYKHRAFVDCGAFTGDTFEALIQHEKTEHYFGFEPNMINCASLCENVRKVPNIKSICFPLGVSDKNEFLRFTEKGAASTIDEKGEAIIQTVRLDDILQGYNNLMIKMDVEGAEIAALNGAKRIITETKPDLAICVYHNLSDLWRIPLMLKEWVPEYQFYMRNHFYSVLDTVVYATIVEN